ncbi:MAG: type IV secretory system conjugative DNA transfer family protein, partial [Chloroflexota bacterium]|nr:type IV secretory system conjugative DNA transfer family protein [Chloroflexota bacterium]
MKQGIALGLLSALLVVWSLGGADLIVGALVHARAQAVERIKQGELAAAYPVIIAWGRLTDLPSATPEASASTKRQKVSWKPIPEHTLRPSDIRSWRAWARLPQGQRWILYSSSPSWQPVRIATRSYLCLLVFAGLLATARSKGLRLLKLLGFPYYLTMWLWQIRPLHPGESHGSASWASERTVKALTPKKGEVPLIIGYKQNRPVALSERQQYEHAFLVAPPGEGKTTTQIIPNLLREPGLRSLLISDPKRELIRACAQQLRKRGHDVWVADWMTPEVSRAYNPLAYITDSYQAELFADAWVQNTGTSSKEPFWDQMSSMLIAGVALHLVATETDEETGQPPPLYRLREVLVEQTPDEVAVTLEKSPVARELRVLLETMAANERLLGSVFTGLAPRLRALKMEPIRRVTSGNEIEFGRMAHNPVALFLGFDFEDREVLAPLNACFFLHFFLSMRKEAKKHHGRLPTPVQCYLDEFGNLGKIPHFDSHITLIRSSRIGVLLVLQSLQQLDKVYGEADAVTIKQSCSTKMALGRLTGRDADYFVNLVGKTTVVSRSKSVSRQTTTVFAGSGNRSEQETARDLITGDELRTLSGQVLVVSGTLDPVLVDQKPYYEDPKLRRLVPDPKKYDALEHLSRQKLGLPELTVPDPAADRD